MKSITHRLYRAHNVLAGALLVIAICCLPKFITILMDYSRHDLDVHYYAIEAFAWGKFIFVAGSYGLFWSLWNEKRTDRRIKATQPPGFVACYEIRQRDKYFGVAKDRANIVIVDMDADFSTCQPLDFVQTFIIQQAEIQSELTLRFNSFEYPCMQFGVRTRAASAIAAKINYALWP